MKINNILAFLFLCLFSLLAIGTKAQYISINGAYVSIGSSTVIAMDTIDNSAGSTLENNGTLTLNTLNNAGTTSGNGTSSIARSFNNTGSFNSGTGTINFNGTGVQAVPALDYYNLTVSGSRGSNSVTYSNAATIGIAGSFNPSAGFTSGGHIITGTTFNFNGSGAQNIPSFNFEKLSCSGGNTKTVTGDITLTDLLKLGTNTTLNLGSGNITLRSTATYTARIDSIPSSASVSYGSGRFIVERYIPGRRKYRLLTSSVTTSPLSSLSAGQEALSIWGNWQNQGNNGTASRGTIITGGASGDGFDQQTTNPSMFTYDEVNRRYVGYASSNGQNTKYTPLKAGVAYYFFVYGDRTNSIIASTPNNTVLTSTGKILTGDQVYNTGSALPLTGVTGRYTMLGNPFASPIDWATVTKTNIEDTYWGWDPNLSSTGGYITVNTAGSVTLISPFSGTVGLNQYIQPGQGFFVRTSGASPEMQIKESDKVSNFNANAFRGMGMNTIPLIAVNLFYHNQDGDPVLADGALAAFDSGYSNTVGKEDAVKILNNGENIGIRNRLQVLSIDARKLPLASDTIFLNSTKLTKPQYSLQIFANKMEGSNLQPYLVDQYLNTLQVLSVADTNWVNFNVSSSDPASSDQSRFSIVFRPTGSLAGTVTSITATKEDTKARINWTVNKETGIQKYALQRSGNGADYSTITEITALGNSGPQSYEYLDLNPVSGMNYYRVVSILPAGANLVSNSARVDMGNIEAFITIFPNPVQNSRFNVQFHAIEPGDYTFLVTDQQGRLMFKQQVTHPGGTFIHHVALKSRLSVGMYYLRVANGKSAYVKPFLVNE